MYLFKKIFYTIIVIFILAASFGLLWMSNNYVTPIIMFHNVDYVAVPEPNSVSPENFEKQLAFIDKHNFHVISLAALVDAINNGKEVSRRSVVLTFDDGYENNYTNAFPILKKYDYPATIFIPSSDIGKVGYLNWDQIREMHEAGIDFESHTKTQAYLPSIPYEEQVKEIKESKLIIEEQLGKEVKFIAYPIGGFSDSIKRIVADAGYQAAVTTNRGYDRFNKDLFELNRVRYSDKDIRSDIFWFKLSGYYNLLRKLRNPN